MKFEMKSLVAAAALVAAGVASASTVTTTVGAPIRITDNERGALSTNRTAEITLLSGSGALQFSNGTGVLDALPPSTGAVGGLVGALNVGKVSVSAVDGALVTETKTLIGRSQTRALVNIAANVTSVSADTATGQILTVGSFGGAKQDALYLEGVLNGGSVTVNNLRFDLATNKVFADMTGTPLVYNPATGLDEPGQTTSVSGIHLWDIGNVIGPKYLAPEALLAAADGNFSLMEAEGYTLVSEVDGLYTVSASNILGKLTVTTAGFNFFANSLGLTPGSTGYTTLAGVNDQIDGWGSVRSNLTFSVREVPEPSTYALMGLGLVGISLVARRRAK